jgi:F0F1-type ATP synthase gamma subunit
MMIQNPTRKRLLPIPLGDEDDKVIHYVPSKEHKSGIMPAYTFEPDEVELLDQIIPRFTALQVYTGNT